MRDHFGMGRISQMPDVAPLGRCIRVSIGPEAALDVVAEVLPAALNAALNAAGKVAG
ncbi:MAG: hypothetical protein WBP18_15380 [Paracoccaceae bacterium]